MFIVYVAHAQGATGREVNTNTSRRKKKTIRETFARTHFGVLLLSAHGALQMTILHSA